MSVQLMRYLIPDVEQIDWNDTGESSYLFTEEHLEGLLELNNGRVKRAAADAVEALGTSEAYISKVIKSEDLQTDGAKVANALFVRARQLRDSDREDEGREAAEFFKIARFQPRPPNYGWRGL
jgi:hypothetical protein